MIYKVLGLMSGSSLDGVDIAFVNFKETAGKWTYELLAANCFPYTVEWKDKLQGSCSLPAYEYLLLHSEYGHYLGKMINNFIITNKIDHQVALIGSHGHTTFHVPHLGMTHQLGDGAAIAAETGLAVVSDLRSLDVALGGQGAPIVPMGEKILFSEFPLLLNIGGIANLSARVNDSYIAFDICPANKILNSLTLTVGLEFDEDGKLSSGGTVCNPLLEELNALSYYKEKYPKSLSNEFGSRVVYPLITKFALSPQDALATYVEHIAEQIDFHIGQLSVHAPNQSPLQLLVTGGGAFNSYLLGRIREKVFKQGIEIVIPEAGLIKYKEAIIMALLGLLRWREENTIATSVSGASRESIGGALWQGS